MTGDSATNYKAGRLTQVSSSVSGTVFRYDALGRVQSSMQTTGTNTYPFLYGYEPVGLTSETYPSGRVVTTAYNDAGRISQVSGAYGGLGSEYESSYTYAPNGGLQQVTRGGNLEYTGAIDNGLVETRSYNDRWQTASVGASFGSTSLLSLSYYYCSGTMVTSCTSNNRNLLWHYVQRPGVNIVQDYAYDGANRITAVGECDLNLSCAFDWSQAFAYDGKGNRAITAEYPTAIVNPVWTATSTSQFNSNNQFVRGTGDVYDGAGNETSVASASAPNTASNTMAYDGENRMVTGNFAGTGNVYYTYDGDGRRITDSATGTTFVYDAMGQLAAEYSTTAPVDAGTLFMTGDALGSTRLVTNTYGAVLKCYDYMPFGEDVPSGVGPRGSGCFTGGSYPTTPDVLSEKFTGKERDAESGLDYFGARYLSSASGRFTSPDEPLYDQQASDPQSWNLYNYVRNNPLRFTDAFGRVSVRPTPVVSRDL